jgi:adenosine/AMP kinase
LADKEYLKLKFESFTGNRQFKMNALNDARALVNSGNIPADSMNTAAVIREMIFEFDKTQNLIGSIDGLSDNDLSYRDRVRSLAAERIAGIAGVNQNAVMFYETVLKRLLEQ